jgi:hypothetical protein
MDNDPLDPIMLGKLKAIAECNYSDWRSDESFLLWCMEHHPEFIQVLVNNETLQDDIQNLQAQGIDPRDVIRGIKLRPRK